MCALNSHERFIRDHDLIHINIPEIKLIKRNKKDVINIVIILKDWSNFFKLIELFVIFCIVHLSLNKPRE